MPEPGNSQVLLWSIFLEGLLVTDPFELPIVSAIIPCRNEEGFVGKCLESLIAADYPKDKLEILVVDGMSTDETMRVIESYVRQYPFIHLLNNPRKILAAAWNIGIGQSRGDVVLGMNAHAVFAPNYISLCVRYLSEYKADYVGGIIKSLPRQATLLGKSIAFAVSHPFGVGNSYFRIGTVEPRWSDTAAFGGYRRQVFERIGLYDEELVRSQDIEFHHRLRKAGGKILLVPEMVCDYFIRSEFDFSFIEYNFGNGFWVTYPLRYVENANSWRHIVPMGFVTVLLGTALMAPFVPVAVWLFLAIAGSYAVADLWAASDIAIKEKDAQYLITMPVVFAALHLSYGLGSLVGLARASMSRKFWRNLWISKWRIR
jgi:glycosyltransferase involved in cell wall biosynthesis